MITDNPKKQKKEFPTGLAIAAAVVLLIGGAAAWYFSQPRESANQPPVLTPEARLYVREGKLKLSDTELKATDSAMAKALVEGGPTSSNYALFPFRHIRRPVYPLDENVSFAGIEQR